MDKKYSCRHAAAIILLIAGLSACTRPTVEQVNLPADVFSLRNEVIALRAQGPAGKKFTQEISLEPLSKTAGKFEAVFLFHYTEGAVKELAHRRDGNKITAELTAGETYLLGARPLGRDRDIYGVLCLLDRQRVYIDQISPSLYGQLCPKILCAPELMRADALFSRIPELKPMQDKIHFGDWQIGGWGPDGGSLNPCDKCQELQKPGRAIPVGPCLTAWVKPVEELIQVETPKGVIKGCKTIIFQDNFEADVVGNTPSASPAGDPTDDALAFPAGSDMFISVIASGPHGSQAARIRRGSASGVVLVGITGGGSHSSGKYRVTFKAYSAEESGLVPAMTISVKSSTGKTALRLIVDNGQYQLVSGGGTETLSVGYAINVADAIEFEINMEAGQISVNINGTNVAANKPFLDTDFEDVKELTFNYPPAILESAGKYDVDDIKICKL